ncbi:MAG: hypothetical protein HGB37_01505 [Candidatus Moranbacteria bacterium]|nr:hypothetical protein [Candidatus Moranbacteria bacterium]
MASKTIGKAYWIGAQKGGFGYFVKYCPHCGESIYLEGEYEMTEMVAALPSVSFRRKAVQYLRQRVRLPRLVLSWGPTEIEAERTILDERMSIFQEAYTGLDVKAFNRDFFDRRYQAQGGVARLEQLIQKKTGPTEIARVFGISAQRAGQIVRAYRLAVSATVNA